MDINVVDEKGETPLHQAIKFGREIIADLLLKHRSDVNTAEKDGVTPLLSAAYSGRPEMIKRLLDAGAEDALDKRGNSALHYAAIRCKAAALQLLASRAFSYHANAFNVTPLHMAAICDDVNSLNALSSYALDPNARDFNGNTPLHYATSFSNGRLDVASALVNMGADINALNNDGKAPWNIQGPRYFPKFEMECVLMSGPEYLQLRNSLLTPINFYQ